VYSPEGNKLWQQQQLLAAPHVHMYVYYVHTFRPCRCQLTDKRLEAMALEMLLPQSVANSQPLLLPHFSCSTVDVVATKFQRFVGNFRPRCKQQGCHLRTLTDTHNAHTHTHTNTHTPATYTYANITESILGNAQKRKFN